jgi:hypothetical protein
MSAIREGSDKFDGSATPDLALIDSEHIDVVWIDVNTQANGIKQLTIN